MVPVMDFLHAVCRAGVATVTRCMREFLITEGIVSEFKVLFMQATTEVVISHSEPGNHTMKLFHWYRAGLSGLWNIIILDFSLKSSCLDKVH